ncbi:hypothetical protein [Jeongeupia chitinilytica]|uniref:Uncharacterized protein n=1 Tax=Jeongeupia chitinilytica TaxID=1041641 RepID=A0ABQ3H2J0_9NEIS|nr:hypothetical protein [Jeongeupia chitinilytica]GHD62512.1 hypothetical protein GCM10007350_18620 [Jeongeupia chitinilytica]
MRRWLTALLLMLTAAGAHAAAEQIAWESTRFGPLRIVRDVPARPFGTLRHQGKTLFKAPDQYLSFDSIAELPGRDVALVFVSDGGSGGGGRYILVVLDRKKARVLQDPRLVSQTAPPRLSVDGSTLRIDLGLSDGLQRTATLKGDTLSFDYASATQARVDIADCDWLHQEAGNVCAPQDGRDCSKVVGERPMYVERALNRMSNYPGFDRRALDARCVSRCTSGEWPSLSEFHRQVCGLPPR